MSRYFPGVDFSTTFRGDTPHGCSTSCSCTAPCSTSWGMYSSRNAECSSAPPLFFLIHGSGCSLQGMSYPCSIHRSTVSDDPIPLQNSPRFRRRWGSSSFGTAAPLSACGLLPSGLSYWAPPLLFFFAALGHLNDLCPCSPQVLQLPANPLLVELRRCRLTEYGP
jgi:hypothetical protein